MQGFPFHSADAPHCSQEIRTFPVSNHSFSVPMTNPFFKIHGAFGSPNVTTNPLKQQPLGGIPVTNPHHVVPVMGSMAGTYASRLQDYLIFIDLDIVCSTFFPPYSHKM